MLQHSVRESFSGKPILVRQGATILTTSYVLCDDFPNPPNDLTQHKTFNGEIDVSRASQMTLYAWLKFGSATDIRVQPRAVMSNRANALSVSDLASADPWTTVTSATGGFDQTMVGHPILISGGSGFDEGYYIITAVNSSTSADIHQACAGTGTPSGANAVVFSEGIVDAVSVASGVATASALEMTWPAALGDVLQVAAFNTIGVHLLRLYAKCTGTATGSDLALGYTLSPVGSI